MTPFAIVWGYLRHDWLERLLNALLLAVAVCLLSVGLWFAHQLETRFLGEIRHVDLVVGAKGSPLQLILSGVFYLDAPTGNIAWADALRLQRNPLVAAAVPLSLGDNALGWRVVGTTPEFLPFHQAELAQGKLWQKPFEAVVGANVAKDLPLGQEFRSGHGLSTMGDDNDHDHKDHDHKDHDHAHEDQDHSSANDHDHAQEDSAATPAASADTDPHAANAYRVVGVLAPTGTVLDNLVLTSLASVWRIHPTDTIVTAPASGDALFGGLTVAPQAADSQVTLLLVKYRTQAAGLGLPRYINQSTGMQAASPVVEINRLLNLLGVGLDALRSMGLALGIAALLALFAALWGALRRRRADLALLRLLGANRLFLFRLLLLEALFITLVAALLGLAVGHLVLYLALSGSPLLLYADPRILVASEWWLMLGVLLLAVVAAVLPAISAYRLPVPSILARLQ
ncbi:MAG: ABC transporter permease [Bacteroidia bacterium]|nr:ABC transporter permease [Bacteroidia bacterium]